MHRREKNNLKKYYDMILIVQNKKKYSSHAFLWPAGYTV
jgi:hypothetical protein